MYEELVGAGYHGELKPWDAFWGQRYAVVHDPDGNGVDLFAPLPVGRVARPSGMPANSLYVPCQMGLVGESGPGRRLRVAARPARASASARCSRRTRASVLGP